MITGIKRVIFDIDGTLLDHGNIEKEANDLANILNINIINSNFILELDGFFAGNERRINGNVVTREFYGEIIEEMIPTLKESGKTHRDFLEAITIRECTLNIGAKEILEYLYKKNYTIAALTNWFRSDQMKIMQGLGMLDYFERFYGWDDCKPKPDEFAYLRSLDGTDIETNIYVGDSAINDIEPAKKLGIKTVGYKINIEKYRKKKYVPDFYIENLLDLKEIL